MKELRKEGEIRRVDQDVITLLALTGARRNEIRMLRWDQLRLDQSLLVLGAGDHKTGRTSGGKSIALVPEAVKILRRQKKIGDCDLVFPGDGCKPIAVNKSWALVRERAGLGNDIVLHSLRHSLATLGAAAGLSAHQIKAMLGHSNIATSSRYVHLAEQRKVEAVTIAAAAFTRGKK
jgi:integrase